MTYNDEKRKYDENVVKLIEKPQEKFIKSPRYRSIHSSRTKLEYARAKSAHKTLGVPQVHLNPPTNFLRKHITECKPRAKTCTPHVHYRPPNYQRKLPKWIPDKIQRKKDNELPRDEVTSRGDGVDFRKKNMDYVKSMKPKTPKPKFVDTRRGEAHDLMRSGLVPIYIHKKNFGQIPSHFKRNVFKIEDEKYKENAFNNYMRCEKYIDKRSSCKYITEDERGKLLEEMKKKYAEIMKLFQCLPFLIDTPPKVKRKAALEVKLKQLEKDIDLIEEHPYIYIYEDVNHRY